MAYTLESPRYTLGYKLTNTASEESTTRSVSGVNFPESATSAQKAEITQQFLERFTAAARVRPSLILAGVTLTDKRDVSQEA